MSTKNLARTAIEGGRRNTDERNASHRGERARTRAWLDKLRGDPDLADATTPVARDHVGKAFSDKLEPCWGWLAAHVGQPWDAVYSELRRRFDTRKLSNKHVVFDHMLWEVDGAGSPGDGFSNPSWRRATRFYVDVDGVLRHRDRRAVLAERHASTQPPALAAARAYAAGRNVGGPAFPAIMNWCVPGPMTWTACVMHRFCRVRHAAHRYVETTPAAIIDRYTAQPGFTGIGAGAWWRTYAVEHAVPSWKCTRFSCADVVWWDALPEAVQRALIVYGGPFT